MQDFGHEFQNGNQPVGEQSAEYSQHSTVSSERFSVHASAPIMLQKSEQINDGPKAEVKFTRPLRDHRAIGGGRQDFWGNLSLGAPSQAPEQEEPDQFAVRHLETDVVHGQDGAVVLGQVLDVDRRRLHVRPFGSRRWCGTGRGTMI